MDEKINNADSKDSESYLARALDEFFVHHHKANVVPLPDEEKWKGTDASSDESLHQFLSFRLSDELFAVSIMDISEIIKPTLFTEIPRTSSELLGISSLRGVIVPVLDLRLLLGLDGLPQTRASRVLVVSKADEKIGLLVDEVLHVIRLNDQDIEPPESFLGRADSEHIIGVGRLDGQMYTLLDLEFMKSPERFVLMQEKGK